MRNSDNGGIIMRKDSLTIDEINDITINAQINAIRTVNHQRVKMYWNIGKRIIEEEQHGRERTVYKKE